MDSRAFSFIDRATIAKDWHARGFSCGMWIDHAGRTWTCPPHSHEELLMVVSGKIEMTVDGKLLKPTVGEEVHIPPGVAHTITNVGGKTARWLYGQPREVRPSRESLLQANDLAHITSSTTT